MTDELALLRRTARDFFVREALPHSERWERQRHVDRAFWRLAGRVGLLCPTVPAEYGGPGGTLLHQIVITEEQNRVLDKGWGNPVHSGMVASYLLDHGTEEQKKRWLPGMVSGTTIAAIAMTEPSAGSDLKGIRSTAVRDGDHYVLNGTKTFISNGGTADLVIVAAKTPASGPGELSLLVVDTRDRAGFRRGRTLDKIGQHAADTAELFFDDVRVPAGNLLGGEGEGLDLLLRQLPQERLLIAVGAVSSAERAVDLTVDYVKDRTLFGRPSFTFQNTRFELAECAALTRVGRAFLDDCVQRHLAGRLDGATAAMAKYWLTDMQCQVVDRCLQLFGGYGYMREYPIARMYADARAQRIYGGANELMKELIARSL
ncbi:acyl-CoA dehydrogenase family protein [Actinomadura montaniterrae]|nr:acyl-CoA dehydrogenase family protein [Actinomadura montaniterrae]